MPYWNWPSSQSDEKYLSIPLVSLSILFICRLCLFQRHLTSTLGIFNVLMSQCKIWKNWKTLFLRIFLWLQLMVMICIPLNPIVIIETRNQSIWWAKTTLSYHRRVRHRICIIGRLGRENEAQKCRVFDPWNNVSLLFGCHFKIFSRLLKIHLFYWIDVIDVILVFPVVHKSDFVYVWAMPSPGQLQCFNGTLLISVVVIKMLYWHEILLKFL